MSVAAAAAVASLAAVAAAAVVSVGVAVVWYQSAWQRGVSDFPWKPPSAAVIAVVVAAVAVVVTDFLETSWRKIWIEIEQSPKQDRNLQAGRRIEKDADASGEVLEMTKVS